jgi:mannosyltransferase
MHHASAYATPSIPTNSPVAVVAERTAAAPSARVGLAAAAAAIAVLYLGLRLWHLSSLSFWYDEVFTLQITHDAPSRMLKMVVTDVVHPPLFYILFQGWVTMGGDGPLWVRLFPVTLSAASVAPFVLLARVLRIDRAATLLGLLFVSVNGLLVFYAQETRMYSLFPLLTLTSLWLFVRFANGDRLRLSAVALVTAVNVLLVYTHYFGWFVVGAEWLALALWRRPRLVEFTAGTAVVALAFAPWAQLVYWMAQQRHGLAGNLGWIPKPHASDVLDLTSAFSGSPVFPGSAWLALAIFGAPVAVWVWQTRTDARPATSAHAGGSGQLPAAWFLALVTVLPVLVAFVASRVWSLSVWHARFFTFVVPVYLLLVAASVRRLTPSALRMAATVGLAAWAIAGGLLEVLRSDRRVPWDAMVAHIDVSEPPADTVRVYALEHVGFVELGYALRGAPAGRFVVQRASRVDDLEGAHFWVAYRSNAWGAVRPETLLVRRGYLVEAPFTRASDNLLTVWPDRESTTVFAVRKDAVGR